jgi:hypothetical protein
MLDQMAEPYGQIRLIPDTPEDYSDPSRVINFYEHSATRFAVSISGSISYMGRECFIDMWNKFLQIKGNPHHRQAIYVYGARGSANPTSWWHWLVSLYATVIELSTFLIAVRCFASRLLISKLHSCLPLQILKPSKVLNNVRRLNIESPTDFCPHHRQVGQMCFVVDQLNALDPELPREDNITNKTKSLFSLLLQHMSARHIEIPTASANHKSAKHMAARDTGDQNIPLMGGMTTKGAVLRRDIVAQLSFSSKCLAGGNVIIIISWLSARQTSRGSKISRGAHS